jgi:isocitrate lyase
MGALKGFKPAALKAALAATNQGSLKLPDLRSASYSGKKTPQLVTVLAARLLQADRKALVDMLPKPDAEEVGNKGPNDPRQP